MDDAALWGLIGTCVGAAASIGTTALTTWGAYRQHSKAAQQARQLQAAAFQRETLLEVQESIHDLMRMTNKWYLDRVALGENASPPEQDDENLRVVQRRLAILNERIADDELRNAVRDLRWNLNSVAMGSVEAHVSAAMAGSVQQFSVVNELLGAVLRGLY